MKTLILTLALLLTYSFANANDFKKQKIQLDDAPISILYSLRGHEIKSVTKYIDQVGNQSYYVVKSKIGGKHYKTTYSVNGIFESRNRRFAAVPVVIGGVFLIVSVLSFGG